jgi:hypothetical protein
MIPLEVLRIAKKARKICEDFAMSDESIEEDYHLQDDLSAMCAVASFFLRDLLIEQGYYCKVRHAHQPMFGHCFIQLEDKAIDITATQFFNSHDKVKVDNLAEHEKWLGLGKSRPIRLKSLRKWPASQKPRTDVMDKLKTLYANN